MLFTHSSFLFYFLPLALALHVVSNLFGRGRQYSQASRICIFALTIVFYGFKHPWWLVPFFICIGFDFLWASRLSKETNPQKRRWLLVISIAQNIGLLAIYKYWSAVEWMLGWASPELPKLAAHYVFFGDEVMLPAGISFYTFESMSFVIDVYRGHVTPPKKPSEFFAFIGMFPRFIAGPIVRYRDMVDQFSCYRGMDVSIGLSLFAVGLFLKSCLADSFAVFVPLAYRVDGVVGPLASWLGVIAYGMQIYFDFSGYSLMAIGLGRCFGFQFPTNFNKPYLCSSLSDFWARWHISFTSWIRDYLFTPMAMAAMRRSKLHFALAVIATVMLSGLWHGAGWTYIVWGLWHGMFLSLERILKIRAKWPGWLHRSTALLIVFLSWVWFRSSGMGQAL